MRYVRLALYRLNSTRRKLVIPTAEGVWTFIFFWRPTRFLSRKGKGR